MTELYRGRDGVMAEVERGVVFVDLPLMVGWVISDILRVDVEKDLAGARIFK